MTTSRRERDISGNGNHAQYVGSLEPTFVSPGAVIVDDALSLTGSDVGLTIPADGITIMGDFSVVFWRRVAPGTGAFENLFSLHGPTTPFCDFQISGDGRLTFSTNGLGCQFTSAQFIFPEDDTWHMAGFDYSIGTGVCALYFDGVAQPPTGIAIPGLANVTATPADATLYGLFVGSGPPYTPSTRAGGLDELSYFPSSIGPSNMAALYAARTDFAAYTAAVLALSPTAYYHLDGTQPSVGWHIDMIGMGA